MEYNLKIIKDRIRFNKAIRRKWQKKQNALMVVETEARIDELKILFNILNKEE